MATSSSLASVASSACAIHAAANSRLSVRACVEDCEGIITGRVRRGCTVVRRRRGVCLRAAEVVAAAVAGAAAASWQTCASCWLVIGAGESACNNDSVACALSCILSPVDAVDVGQHRLRAVSHVNPVPHVVPANTSERRRLHLAYRQCKRQLASDHCCTRC